MLKVSPHPDYPPEEGRYVRGNDSSPVAVAIVLHCDADKVPPDLERLVRAAVESGAALSGTVQTENIGFEKIVCNIVANPNIRYLIIGGPESEGHSTGEALKASEERYRSLVENSPDSISVSIGSEIVYANRKRLELTGHSHQSELIGSNGLVNVFPEDREEILKRIRARERGEVTASFQEFRLLRGEGSIVHVKARNIKWSERVNVSGACLDR